MSHAHRKRPLEGTDHDDDLLHVCAAIGVSEKIVEKLQLCGILSITDIILQKDKLKDRRLRDINKNIQKLFYDTCRWHDSFVKRNRQPVVWLTDFTEDVFSSFQEMPAPSAFGPEDVFAVAKQLLHSGDTREGGLKFAEEDIDKMYQWAAEETVNALSKELKDKCFFDVKEVAAEWYEAIFSGEKKQFNVHGHTQSGKSTLKALAYAICEMVSLPLVVITKGLAESKDLKKKISKLLMGCQHKHSPTGTWWKTEIEMLYVIADTAAQINRAVKRLKSIRNNQPYLKFAVILDECDAMYRTAGREQQTEMAFDELMRLGPELPVFITATPIPALLTHIFRQGKEDIRMLNIGTDIDYSGIKDLHPLEDEAGNEIFLRHGSLARSRGVEYSCNVSRLGLEKWDKETLFPRNDKIGDVEANDIFPSTRRRDFIPYTNEDAMRLYDDAIAASKTKQGALPLDCSCPTVTAKDNIFDKACCLQNHYRAEHEDIFIVINVGRGVYFRRPGFRHGRFTKRTVSEVLQRLDEKYGLDIPIFVFGYTKMRRCVSYRSDGRVPTHMLLMLGQAQSNENFIQALGRATFNGRSVLNQNGHEYPKILTNEDDFVMAKKYANYVDKVHARQKKGDTPRQALLGENEPFTHEENFILHSNRKTGQDKTLKSLLPTSDAFVEPSAADHVNKKDLYWNEPVVQGVLYAIRDLYDESSSSCESQGDSQFTTQDSRRPQFLGFTADSILEMYNETYQFNEKYGRLKKGNINKILTELKREVLLFQDGKDHRGHWFWKAKNVKVLRDMLNPEFEFEFT